MRYSGDVYEYIALDTDYIIAIAAKLLMLDLIYKNKCTLQL